MIAIKLQLRRMLRSLSFGTKAIQNVLLLVTLATSFSIVSSSVAAFGQSAPRVQVVLARLVCRHTTEQGHDEFYYLLGGVDGSGRQVQVRGPNGTQGADADNQTAWDMNDSGSKKNRTLNAVLYEGLLQAGRTATLNFAFEESDGTNFGATVNAAGKLAAEQSANPYLLLGGKIAQFVSQFIPANQDDTLGGFSLRLKNSGGNLVIETATTSFTTAVQPFNPAVGTLTYRFQNDDGDYVAYFQVNLVR